MTEEKKDKRGFASMDRAKQREIASRGGRAAHEKGTAHQFNTEEAREAGRKGGQKVSQDRQHMTEIGRKGGESRASNQPSP
ncbi:MAG TPA: KGG domain-containing protein [Planktothrix sp.]